MEDKIISYKGMDKNMQCRGMQYAVGEEFTVDGEIECCGNGLHACERPLDVLNYYAPGDGSRYFRVTQSGDLARDGDNSKVASRKMRVDAEIGIPGLVKAHIEYVKAHTTTEHTDPERATAGNRGAATAGNRGAATAGYLGAATAGDCGAATAGDCGAATAGYLGAATAGNCGAATAGDCGAATAGNCGAATAGNCGAATAGNCGAATAGDRGAATAGNLGAATAGYLGAATAGDCGAATAGNCGAATAGNCGAATAGDRGAATSRGRASVGENGIASARCSHPMAKGGIGAVLVLARERDDNYDLLCWNSAVVDGKTIKANTWYTIDDDGEIVEAEEGAQA